MTIVPIPSENCASVNDFWRRGGEVEIPRPGQCLNAVCMLTAPLRKNGSYLRQVVYWGIAFAVMISRFRCRRCGRTISCPYSWLVPYRRFAAELIAAGLEAYADTRVSYLGTSTELSDLDFADPEFDIRDTESYKKLARASDSVASSAAVEAEKAIKSVKKKSHDDGNENQCPAHTTVFYWVKYLCQKAEKLLVQVQKEFVREWKRSQRRLRLPPGSTVVNPNYDKAQSPEKIGQLNQVTMLSIAARELTGNGVYHWQKLRAYFLIKAETCKDILTNTTVVLTRTHSFEFDY